ncbi:MAG: VOC family protein [Vagococcus sp.]|uniref:VOC family protein n=1 Tax=Vagococcus sp. TaxID=1933889 RepID=UPI002FC633A3
MKLDMIGIIVKDMKRAITFYQMLGLNVIFGDEKADYVELNNASVRLSLNTKQMITTVLGFEPKTTGDKIELAFLCENKEEVNSRVESLRNANVEVLKEPWSAPWGQYYALVRDYDGNIISLFVEE